MKIYLRKTSLFQLSSWFEELRQELQSDEVAENVEGAEQLLEQFNQQRDSTIDAAMNTVSEGEALLEELQQVFFKIVFILHYQIFDYFYPKIQLC